MPDAYLRLHLLSSRACAPRTVNLDGIFGVLPNVVWTSAGPCAVEGFEEVRAARRSKMGEIDSIAQRDAADSKRAAAPLVVANGATILDNSYLNIPESVDAALKILTQQGLSLSAL